MKCCHLRWVSHTLAAAQKVVSVELGECMLQALAKRKRNHFHFLLTGDESCIFYAYDHRTMWVSFWDDVDEIERSSHFQQKTMLTIFFDRTREYKIVILPAGQKVHRTYFMECVLGPLTEVCYSQGRKSHIRRVTLHFDNAPIHNTEEVQGHLTNLGFTRMEHPFDSPDLAPCDFFRFGTMKENFSGQHFECVEELVLAVKAFLRGLSADFLQTVFLEWEG
jgi:hypothetical protein